MGLYQYSLKSPLTREVICLLILLLLAGTNGKLPIQHKMWIFILNLQTNFYSKMFIH